MSVDRIGSLFRRRWWLVVPAFCLLAGAAYALVSWGTPKAQNAGAPPPTAGHPVPVVAEAARTGDIPVYLNGIGTVTPLATVTVKSRVDGELVTVLFRVSTSFDIKIGRGKSNIRRSVPSRRTAKTIRRVRAHAV